MDRAAHAIAWLLAWPWVWRYYWRTRKLAAIERPVLPLLLNQAWIQDQWWREQLADLDELAEGLGDG